MTLPLQREHIVAGEVIRLRYSSEETGRAIVVLDVEGEGEVVIVGFLSQLRPGDHVRVWGSRVTDPKWGDQVQADEVRVDLPASAEGVRRYLMRFPGIGLGSAHTLVETFGTDALRLVLEEPDRIRAVLPARYAEPLIQGVAEDAVRAGAHAELLSLGLQGRFLNAASRKWGASVVATVRENPYILEEIDGIGFKFSDEVARRVGFPPNHPLRIRSGIFHTLSDATQRGHCFLSIRQLHSQACRLLHLKLDSIDEELASMEQANRIVVDGRVVYPAGLWIAEESVAQHLARLSKKQDCSLFGLEDLVLGLEDVDDVQREAVRMALTCPVSIITGGPGVGKTHITRHVVELAESLGLGVYLCAPTGRAAKRLAEATGHDAMTIHRMLRYHPGQQPQPDDTLRENATEAEKELHRERQERKTFKKGWWRHNASFPLGSRPDGVDGNDWDDTPCDLVILDESSMVDVALMRRLLDALPDTARLLIVGDVDQLPSVQPGAVLRDLIGSERFPVTRLQTVYRQAEGSSILLNAHRVNRGEMPVPPVGPEIHRAGGDYFHVQKSTPEAALEMAVKMATDRIPFRYGFDPARDVWVLSPMKKGPSGTYALNDALRDALNPLRAGQIDRKLRIGDRVMQMRNDYDLQVYNGEWGIVERIDDDPFLLMIRMGDDPNRVVVYDKDKVKHLQLAWAATVHKFQGCEVPAIVLVLQASQVAMLSRKLLYTAMTRARELLVIVGDQAAVETAVKDAGGFDKVRSTLLGERVQRVITVTV